MFEVFLEVLSGFLHGAVIRAVAPINLDLFAFFCGFLQFLKEIKEKFILKTMP